MIDPDRPSPSRPSAVQRLGAVAWPSFFVAMVVSALFFSVFDPLALQRIGFPGHAVSRAFGYSAGFFLAWLATFSACAVTALLLQPGTDDGSSLE
ncbi:hypothetical protein [Stenotrophomonas mori]|uniref:Uncharacterized protein n=1 Tax=Stenotrophomonas mori TaxID=2871096 RepID=A0ABT0SFT0_9GAMM|nr:hypothetical protein [Stenotrophomonas mori]MCL7714179.1 hypothetical protein [Stenotrophomonas mori]